MFRLWMDGGAAAAALLLALALPACGDDDEDTRNVARPDAGAGDGRDAGTTPDAGGGAGDFTIVIQNFAFVPASLSVPPGATITVENRDTVEHSVTSQSAARSFEFGAVNGVSFDTGEFDTGARTFTIPTTAPRGTLIPYFCTEHEADMANDGSITIR